MYLHEIFQNRLANKSLLGFQYQIGEDDGFKYLYDDKNKYMIARPTFLRPASYVIVVDVTSSFKEALQKFLRDE